MELPAVIEKYRTRLESTSRMSNEIIFSLEETKPWESKLGGCPYLEHLEDYPIGVNERPMMFLAQINLEEMPPLEDFPTKGILQFYIEDVECGLDEACVVKYIENYTKDETRLLKENPYRDNYEDYEPFTNDGKITFKQRQMAFTSSSERFEEMFLQDATEEEKDALYAVCNAADSRVGGFPYFVQYAPGYYDNGTCDVLLLQLDIDDVCGIMFGDSGNCTFLISKENLIKRDFSNVEYDWQCC